MRMRRRAMTLIEVTIALTVTAMIGLVTASVMVALLNVQQTTDSYTQNVQSGRISLAKLQSAIRTSRVVTAGNGTKLTLWTHDDFDPGAMNVDELAVLKFIPEEGVVRVFAVGFADGLSQATRDALNVQVELDQVSSSSVAVSKIIATGSLITTDIAADLSSLMFRYDASPPYTGVVSIDASFGDGEQVVKLSTSAALRAPAIEWVSIND